MGLWINKKRFWAVKLIYNNERLNNSIKYDRGVLEMRMVMKMKNVNEKWEWLWKWKMRMRNDNDYENEKWE